MMKKKNGNGQAFATVIWRERKSPAKRQKKVFRQPADHDDVHEFTTKLHKGKHDGTVIGKIEVIFH